MDQWFKRYIYEVKEHFYRHPWLHGLAILLPLLAAIVLSVPARSEAPDQTIAYGTTTTTTIPPTTTTQASSYLDAKDMRIYTTTTTTTTTVPVEKPYDPYSYRCSQWYDLAKAVGWTDKYWPTLSRVLYKESRCSTDAYNPSDPNGGSYGLTQINGYWCESNQWNPTGYLQARGILTTCEDLYKPEVNLLAALEVFSRNHSWSPWGL